MTVPSTGFFRLALRLTCSTFLQTDLSLNLCSNCKLFSSPSLRTLAQRHRQNGEILVSDLNPRASVLRRSSSTCATRTLNRQGCKTASGTRNLHHQSFSDFDAPHRQPVHLYNGSPGLQRQLLTPIREVRAHPTPSHLTDAAQLWNGRSSFTITAIPAGALVSPLQNHFHPLFPLALCHITSQTSCGGPPGSCVLPVGKRRQDLPFSSKSGGCFSPCKRTSTSISSSSTLYHCLPPNWLFHGSQSDWTHSQWETGDKTSHSSTLVVGIFHYNDTFPLPSAQLAFSRRSIWGLRFPSGKLARRLILCPILICKFPPAKHTFPPARAI